MDIKDLLISDIPSPNNVPFPHIFSNNLFNRDVLHKVLERFPKDDDPLWEGETLEKKQYGYTVDKLDPYIQEVLEALSSKEIRTQIQQSFNTPKLYAVMVGASAHITGPWTHNKMHVDWQMYGHRLFRWINLHIFLNLDYKPEHSGELILGDERAVITPEFGNSALFLSTHKTPHGQNVWRRDDTRKSLAVFYFAEKPHNDCKQRLTYVDHGEEFCEQIILDQS